MEYLILIGFVMTLLIPLILLFYNQSAGTASEVRSQQLLNIGQKIVDNAESVFYLGAPAKLQFKIYLPEGIQNVTATNRALIFKIVSGSSTSDLVIPSAINLTGVLPSTTGVHIVTVESRGNYVALNST